MHLTILISMVYVDLLWFSYNHLYVVGNKIGVISLKKNQV